MCFSATASFASAAAIALVGLFSLSKARSFPMYLFALTPLLFALQQTLEGVVWISLLHGDSTGLWYHLAAYGFLFFAGMFWPVWLPLCLFLLEEQPRRKRVLRILFLIGMLVSADLLWRLLLQGDAAVIADGHICYSMFALTYDLHAIYPFLYQHYPDIGLTIAYLLAVVVPFFISSVSDMWVIGLLAALGFLVAEVFFALAFGSVWCFFGALSSLATYSIVSGYESRHAHTPRSTD